ncbi:hypothetical protein NCC49_005675 [Naganishia albida]|nr:hypothetical protein NCC49_005675 [Naganishia albida]
MPGFKAIQGKLGYGPHVMILFIFAFAAFILSLLVTFSAPFIKTIYFLSASNTNFGTFGFAQPTALVTSDSRLGYEYGTQVLSPLTSSMILWGIVDIFLFFQLMGVIPLLWVHDSQALHAVANSTFFTYSSYLSVLLITVTWPISIVGWSIAQRGFELSVPNSQPKLGGAIWMGLTVFILQWLIVLLGWPADQLGRNDTASNRYYHYRQTTREVTRPQVAQAY